MGVAALKKVSGLERAPVGEWDVAFRLAPRINAAGRMAHGLEAFDLLVCESEAEADGLARLLDERNTERRGVEESVLGSAGRLAESALESGPKNALVLAAEGWHPGVAGIGAQLLFPTVW